MALYKFRIIIIIYYYQEAGPYNVSTAATSPAAGSATRRVQAGSLDV